MRSEGRHPARSKRRPLDLEGLEPRVLLSAPVIQSVEDQPDPIEQDDLLTLTARSVTDPDGGSIAGVSFYRSADDVFDGAPTDPLIGAATRIGVTDDWEWSDAASWAPGDYYYFARATDDGEGAAGIGGNLYYDDVVVENGTWDAGEEIWADQNANGQYDAGIDTQVYDGGDGWEMLDGNPGIQGNLAFQDTDSSTDWTSGEAVWAEGVADGEYHAADDSPIVGTPAETSAGVFTTGEVNAPPTIGPQQVITTAADGARSVYACDLDGDGDADVLWASESEDKIAWCENLGGGGFGAQQVITNAADGAWSVYARDLDGDGDADVLSGSFNDDKIAWYKNLGGGSFGAQQVITATADQATCVYACDLDGDSDADVLSASRNEDKVAWYENLGGGSFGAQQVITMAADLVYSVYARDLDGDGDADVLSASAMDNKVAWYENLGGGSFGAQQVITTAADGAFSVYAADLDGDGDADVLSASYDDDKIAWYENLGGGSFGAQQVITTAADWACCVYATDLDGDGDADVLSASAMDNKVAWYENLGGGSFGTQQVITMAADGPRFVYAADLDGDGDADVLSASYNDDKIAWYENRGDGTFVGLHGSPDPVNQGEVLALTVPDVSDPDGTVVQVEFHRDANSNGTLEVGTDDLLGADSNGADGWSWTGAATWPLGTHTYFARAQDDDLAWSDAVSATGEVNAPPTIGPQQVITTAADGAKSVYASDLDGDGDADVLSASFFDDKIAWYENVGGGSFGGQQVVTTAADYPNSVYACDLDGDGDADVLSASEDDGKIAWYENLGAGSFGPQQVITTAADGAFSVHALDLDGDGDADVLSAWYNDDKIAWYENLGAGTFGPQQVITVSADYALSVYGTDLDGDGDADVLSASHYDAKIAWYENLGGGSFGAQQVITTQASGAMSVYAVDLDGDGDADVLSASRFDDKVAWYENLGGGSFGAQQVIMSAAGYPFSVYACDLDGDGDADVLSASYDGDKIAWYENLGGGSFGPQQVITTAVNAALSVYACDLDGDGDWDVLSASQGDDKIAWYENRGDGTFVGVLNDTPDPVAIGSDLTLTALGVGDQDGIVVLVEFYRDANDNGVLDIGTDTLLGSDTDGADGWSWTGAAAWPWGMHTYFARAQDDDGAWSDPAAGDGRVNARPAIGNLEDSPDPVNQGEALTLTTPDVSDPDGTVTGVEFYWDANGNGTLELGTDDLLGTDSNGADGWNWMGTATWPWGMHTYFARAQDDDGAWSDPAAGDGRVNARPAIDNLEDSPDPVAIGSDLTLTALGVGDQDGIVVLVEFYRDANGNGTLELGTDDLLGTDSNGADGWNWMGTATWPWGMHTYFARAQDDDGAWSDPAAGDGRVNARPAIGNLEDSPDPVTQGEILTLTAISVSDTDGTVVQVEFYVDTNGNGTLETGTDTLLGSDSDPSGGWNWMGAATWPSGMHTYFARAQDDDGAWSNVVSATGGINVLPTIGSLSDTPDPAEQNSSLTLSANDVSDPDGIVVLVEFYRDANDNGVLDIGTDTFLGSDNDGADGWNWMGAATWPWGTHTYFARAQDDDGAWSDPAAGDGRVNARPAIDNLEDSPDPVAIGSDLTLTALGVGDQDGSVVLVRFYGDGNANGVLDLTVDAFLGPDADGGDGWSWTGSTAGWGIGTFAYFARARDNDGAWSDVATVEGTVTGENALVESHTYTDGVTVTLHDANAANGVSAPDIAWSVAELEPGVTDVLVDPGAPADGVIDSITLLGDGTDTEELGFVIEGGLSLGTFSDERSGTPPVAFLACEGDIGEVYARAGAAGSDLNGFTASGGWALPADLDGDGVTDDLTAFYASGSIGMLMAWDDLDGDVVCGQGLSTMQVLGGDLNADLACGGSLGRFEVRALDPSGTGARVGGNVVGNVSVSGSVREFAVVGGDLIGDLASGGNIGRVGASPVWDGPASAWVGGSVRGALHAGGHLSALVVRGADGVVGDAVADGGIRREEVAVSLAGSAVASNDPGLPNVARIPDAPSLRTGAVDEVFVTGRIGQGDTTGGWTILRAAARGFWLAGPSVGHWTTDEDRVYFGGVYGWDVCF